MPGQNEAPSREEALGLAIDTANGPDAFILRLGGELDLATCPDLELALEEAERSRAARLVLDLENLTFIDARGLGAIARASRRSALNGNRLQITRGNGAVARTFRASGLDQVLPFAHPCLCPEIEDIRQ